MSHQQRVSVHDVDRAGYQAVLALEKHVRDSGLDRRLYELVKIRASQLNGCAFCLDMHNRDARTAGEDQRRLDVLSAWREAPTLFSDRERAALAFTEAVTRIGDVGVPDPVWADVVESFGERDAVHLLLAVAVITCGTGSRWRHARRCRTDRGRGPTHCTTAFRDAHGGSHRRTFTRRNWPTLSSPAVAPAIPSNNSSLNLRLASSLSQRVLRQ